MFATDKTEAPVQQLIELSRSAVRRARQAVAAAKEFDREARDAEMRKLRDDSERLVQRLEHKLALAQELLASLPKGRRHH